MPRPALFLALLLSSAAIAQTPTAPPPNQHAILTLQGRGAQVYGCQLVGSTFQWVFQAPVARLFDANNTEVGTHADGPTWTYQDSSSIEGALLSKTNAPNATADIPWLLLKAINPQRTGILTKVEFISRTTTQGGVIPTTACDAAQKGDLARVPYTATYTFYSSAAAPTPTPTQN